jgi:two-component system CheB/CheR fusion protein
MFSAEAQEKNISLTLEKGTGNHDVEVDPQRMEQVITNVVGNAIKFTPKGGEVRIALDAHRDCARIQVHDTGVGIDAATLPRIFQLFRQGEGKRKRESGLGLGLSITRHLVELHDGSVHVHSDGPGRGSTFTLEIPLLQVGAVLLSSMTAQDTRDHQLPPSRVLVVDDEQEMREVTVRMLRSFGAEVVDVIDASSALAWLEREQFDLVVSDIMMPGIDGMEFARALRERHGPTRPLLALTALSSGAASEQARRAGFTAFLTKPVTRNVLYRAVHDLLGPV